MRRKEFRQGSTRVRPPVRPPTAWRSYCAASPMTIGGLGGLTFKPSLLLVFEHRQACGGLTWRPYVLPAQNGHQ